MLRHHITLGASTTAGGRVVAASARWTICGRAVALEGDAVACPACKSVGTIQCIGPRLVELYDGRAVALEHDLCACQCPVAPSLLADQSQSSQTIEGAAFMLAPGGLPASVATPSAGLCLVCLAAAAARGAALVPRG
jgi:uncharacterized Zn-binding protein involved in type VI secretion